MSLGDVAQAILEQAAVVWPVPPVTPPPVDWDGLKQLVTRHVGDGPKRLRCHPGVLSALAAAVPADDTWPLPSRILMPVIDVVVTASLPPGGWELVDTQGGVIDQGVIAA